jgi:hypothetical protein
MRDIYKAVDSVRKQQVKDAFAAVAAIAETIREVGRIPSGTVYAVLCGRMSHEAYTKAIGILVSTKLIRETAQHELVWTGPIYQEPFVSKLEADRQVGATEPRTEV